MRNFIIKFLKIFLVFLISTLITYNCFLAKNYFDICNEYQVGIIYEDNIVNLDNEKINGLGNSVRVFADLLEGEKNKTTEKSSNVHSGNSEEYSFADSYDSLGFSVRTQIEHIMNRLFKSSITISVLIGTAITFAYTIITLKNLNPIIKIIIGYISVMIAFPPICMYSWTGRFWELKTMYWYSAPKCFYVVYTSIFLCIYIINYIISAKFTKQLNKFVKNKEGENER